MNDRITSFEVSIEEMKDALNEEGLCGFNNDYENGYTLNEVIRMFGRKSMVSIYKEIVEYAKESIVRCEFADRISTRPMMTYPISDFNDHPDTQLSDVLKVLDTIIILAKENQEVLS